MSTVKVGDVVAWDKVPSGALVKQGHSFIVRMGDGGWHVGGPDGAWSSFSTWSDGEPSEPWPWKGSGIGLLSIVALNVRANATAADLQRLAEVFEVREVLQVEDAYQFKVGECYHFFSVALGRNVVSRVRGPGSADEARGWVATLLHRAGWRPGMTAEDAARLLAEDAARMLVEVRS